MTADDRDFVTGLQHRSRFEATLDALLRERAVFAAVAVDVIGLKRANEEGGFVAGDAVLGAAADRLRSAAVGAAGLYRMGGDELVALYAGPDSDRRAEAAVQNLRGTAAPPRLRVGTTRAAADDTRESLLDRLYATLRRS